MDSNHRWPTPRQRGFAPEVSVQTSKIEEAATLPIQPPIISNEIEVNDLSDLRLPSYEGEDSRIHIESSSGAGFGGFGLMLES